MKLSLSSSLQHNDEGDLKKHFDSSRRFYVVDFFIPSLYNFVDSIQPIFYGGLLFKTSVRTKVGIVETLVQGMVTEV